MASKVVDLTIRLKDKVSGSLGKIKNGLSSVTAGIKKMAASLGLASVGIGALIADAAQFNIAMARVWTMAGGGIDTFKRLRNEARGLSAEFGIARKEMAGGFYNALSAGVEENNLIEFMRTASKVAVADGTEVSTAIDGMTTVLNAFKLESSQAGAVADAMFKTVARGKTNFDDLAKNIAQVAPVAAASNVEFKQVLASMATMTKQGMKTAVSATYLRGAIIGMNKALGDGWSETMSLQDGMQLLWEKSGQSQTKLQELIGTVEGVQAILAHVGKNAAGAADDLASTAESAETLSDAVGKVQQFYQWNVLIESGRAAVSKFYEIISQKLAPSLKKISARMREITTDGTIEAWANKASAAFEAVSKTIKIISGGGEGRTAVAEAVGRVISESFKKGASLAVEALIKAAPVIGKMIGDGFKNVAVAIAERENIRRQVESSPEWEKTPFMEKGTLFAGDATKKLKAERAARNSDLLQKALSEYEAKKRKEVVDESINSLGEQTDGLDAALENLNAVLEKFYTEAPPTTSPPVGDTPSGGIPTGDAPSGGIPTGDAPVGDQTGLPKGSDRGGFAMIAQRLLESGEVSKRKLTSTIEAIAGYEKRGREAGFTGLGESAADLFAGGESSRNVETLIKSIMDAQLSGEGILGQDIDDPLVELTKKTNEILEKKLGGVKSGEDKS